MADDDDDDDNDDLSPLMLLTVMKMRWPAAVATDDDCLGNECFNAIAAAAADCRQLT
jgi:hypothetical protein